MITIESAMLVPGAPVTQLPYPISKAGTAESRTVETTQLETLRREEAVSPALGRQRSGLGCELETIRRAQLGDALAWETLVRQNIGWILNTCGRWAGSRAHAEDLTQDVLIRVFQTLHSYQGERAGFRIWLRRITRNLLIDDYRRNRKERRTMSYDSADEYTQHVVRSVPCRGSGPEARAEGQELRAALCRALRLLGPELRAAVILRDVKGLAYHEISQRVMAPVGTVKSRVNRGRIELVRLLRQGTVSAHGFGPKASAVT